MSTAECDRFTPSLRWYTSLSIAPHGSSMRVTLSAVLLSLAVLSIAVHAQTASQSAAVVLHCPNLFDSVSGKMLGETTVVIAGERIQQVLNGYQSPAGGNVIELRGQTCLPGLIDDHAHLTDE